MLSSIGMGVLLGLSAGFAPGPLFALVISETLRVGIRAGLVVALAPLLTDLPIVCLSIFLLSQYSQSAIVLGIISLLGSAFVFYLGIDSFKVIDETPADDSDSSYSLKKALIVNTLSPHPYLFWMTVGAPVVISSSEQNYWTAAVFVASFYMLLIGSKIFLALAVAQSRNFLVGKGYRIIMKILGFALWVLAGVLFCDGLELLEII